MYNIFIIIPTGEVLHTRQPKAPELQQLQDACGGYVQQIPRFRKFEHEGKKYSRGYAFCNEDGISQRLPYNAEAQKRWKAQCEWASGLNGPVLFYAKEPKS